MKQRKLLNRSALKIIGLISMLLDHIGCIVVYSMYLSACVVNGVEMLGGYRPERAKMLYLIYMILRSIGRIAFPIFAFMIVEGFHHAHDRKKYLGRLILFALISEVPFDLAFTNCVFEPYEQNVLWTFVIAVIMMWLLEKYGIPRGKDGKHMINSVLIVCAAALLSLFTDCGVGGILLIASMYLFFKEQKKLYWISCILSMLVLTIQFMWIQIFSLIALVLLEFYNGEKGRDWKYLFYIFYPAHLIILWLVPNLL